MNEIAPALPRIGFGLGRLHHVVSRKERERIVIGAIDAGCTHFDVAPAYGDGLCEAEVGRILKVRRCDVTLATKFGIPCATLGAQSAPIYFASKAFRKMFSSTYGNEYSKRDFSPTAAVNSLELSLKRLRTDHVDYLFFHEPRGLSDFRIATETVEVMDRLKQAGKVRHYGVSARTDSLLEALRQGQLIGEAVQFEMSTESPTLVRALPVDCHVLSFGLIRFLAPEYRRERLDYANVLWWFFKLYPSAMPILSTNRVRELARLGKAIKAMR